MPIISQKGGSGGGSYTAPITREQISGGVVTVANGATGNMTWVTPFGDALLDLTAPAAPTVVTTGVYVVTAWVGSVGAGMTATGFFTARLDLDLAGDDPEVEQTSSVASATNTHPSVCLTIPYYLPAGAVLRVQVDNSDGAASRDFSLRLAVVQRVS